MASDNKFSHISVNAGDDDVVIHAGAPAAVEEDLQPVAEEEATAQPAEDDFAADLPEEEAQPAAAAPARPAKAAYHETTLEDVQGSKMGTTQKVVIVLAVLLVAAIVVWQVAFNG